MDLIALKLNLTKLPKSAVIEKKGKKFLVLKIDDTRLFLSDKGNVFLDAVAIPYKEKKYDDDYFITESVTQDERKKGIQGEIFGNARILGGGGEQTQVSDEETSDAVSDTENDDLPF